MVSDHAATTLVHDCLTSSFLGSEFGLLLSAYFLCCIYYVGLCIICTISRCPSKWSVYGALMDGIYRLGVRDKVGGLYSWRFNQASASGSIHCFFYSKEPLIM